MPIENIMYFALGVLVAGLLALLVLPAVWKRAVRLTTKRIEAATPITMAEFRADKDQLRAEFALSTRRLEMTIDALRKRLSDELRDKTRAATELGGMKGERDTHQSVLRALEEREAELRAELAKREAEHTALLGRFEALQQDQAESQSQLESASEAIRSTVPRLAAIDGQTLSGDYARDVEAMIEALEVERRRAGFLETQNRALVARLESIDRAEVDRAAAAATERRQSAVAPDPDVEARIAEVGSQLSAMLAPDGGEDAPPGPTDLERLRDEVLSVEAAITAGVEDLPRLRERLAGLAADVSRLVYAEEAPTAPIEESLFDRVQRFAAAADNPTVFPLQAALEQKRSARTPAGEPGGSR